MHTIGIDFGTSYCTASWINPSTGRAEPIRFIENGREKMPSVVYYDEGKPIVGQAAYEMIENLNSYPEDQRDHILMSIKKSIKRDMRKGQIEYLPDGSSKTHEQIIADILSKVKSQAEQTCFRGQKVEGVTITHPVEFANWQKELLITSAKMAGFKSVKLLEEPVAAALGYANSNANVGKGILVYDFGGGTFDVAYVQKEGDEFRIPIPPVGDARCGGEDIDFALYEQFDKMVQQQFNRNISSHPGRADLQFLSRCCKHKESLSYNESHQFGEVLPPPGFNRFSVKKSQNDLEKIITPIVDNTIGKTKSLLASLEKEGLNVDTVVLIGGSSRIPLVEKELAKILPVSPLKTMDVDVAVALGAIAANVVIKKEKIKIKFCISCGKQVGKDDRFCMYCGSNDLAFRKQQNNNNTFCSSCNKILEKGDKFCMYCGSPNIQTGRKTYNVSNSNTCSVCGKAANGEDKFCVYCGKTLK